LKRIFLLRAYGDFIVALQSLLNSSNIASYELIASLHHRSLFEALPASLIPADLPIRFTDFGIKGSMLRAFTNRHLFHAETIHELQAIAGFCKLNPAPKGGNFIENIHRKWLLELGTGETFHAIAVNVNVYTSFHDFFKTVPPKFHQTPINTQKILILPSARINKRAIPDSVIQHIVQKYPNQVVDIAYFKKVKNDSISYANFMELVHLIQQADYIYGADSLPIHLSNLLQKPHTIVHPAGITHQFFTPHALEQNAHFAFNPFN
jgi:hypothetical protein